ncbi:MAG: hypothetical protein AAFQ59_12130 [Pseudomonadota bacterium]
MARAFTDDCHCRLGADASVVMVYRDDVNIRATWLGKSIGNERVPLRIDCAQLLDICDALGLDGIVTLHASVSRSVIRSLEDHCDVWTQRDVTEGIIAQTVNALKLPGYTRAVPVLCDGETADMAPDTERPKDHTILVAVSDDMRRPLEDPVTAKNK